MKNKKYMRPAAIVFALLLWQGISMAIGSSVILASPVATVKRLVSLFAEPGFYRALGFSFVRISTGFILAFITGALLAALAGKYYAAEAFFKPFMSAIRATPVASFIILCLLWIGSRNLSIVISFLMVMPIIYTNILAGIKSTDPKMLEMSRIFELPASKKIKYIYLPAVRSHVGSACSVAIGMAWKSGIAAEVIGIPGGSVGEKLYQAKIYLSSGDLLAWTVCIIALSVLSEKAISALVDLIYKRLEKS